MCIRDRGVEDEAFLDACRQLDSRRIPYVFVGTDCRAAGRLCCVTGCNEIAGKIAADLFLNLQSGQGGKIILTGDFSIEDQQQNALGFEEQIGRYGKNYRIDVYKRQGSAQRNYKNIINFFTNISFLSHHGI